eukprot:358250-Chlamydomonas_euryale.AAC.2
MAIIYTYHMCKHCVFDWSRRGKVTDRSTPVNMETTQACARPAVVWNTYISMHVYTETTIARVSAG